MTRSFSRSARNFDKPPSVGFSKEEVHDSSDETVPKEEFRVSRVDPEEAAAYWKARCNLEHSPPPLPRTVGSEKTTFQKDSFGRVEQM